MVYVCVVYVYIICMCMHVYVCAYHICVLCNVRVHVLCVHMCVYLCIRVHTCVCYVIYVCVCVQYIGKYLLSQWLHSVSIFKVCNSVYVIVYTLMCVHVLCLYMYFILYVRITN